MTQDTEPAAVSAEFLSSLIADIAALEPQDISVARSSFDDFDDTDLVRYAINVRAIGRLLVKYRMRMAASYAPLPVTRTKQDRNKPITEEQRAEKNRKRREHYAKYGTQIISELPSGRKRKIKSPIPTLTGNTTKE